MISHPGPEIAALELATMAHDEGRPERQDRRVEPGKWLPCCADRTHARDNCPQVSNPTQLDLDGDGSGDACDACPSDPGNDPDGDGVCAAVDNCPAKKNALQQDADRDGAGDACDVCPLDPANDGDGDGVCANVDNCPYDPNPDQKDSDRDGRGDVCDDCGDTDADGVCRDVDNCHDVANADQADYDADGTGDACDNCRCVPNDQADADDDGAGDRCDVMPDRFDGRCFMGSTADGILVPQSEVSCGNVDGGPAGGINSTVSLEVCL